MKHKEAMSTANSPTKMWSACFRNALIAIICNTFSPNLALAAPIKILVLDAHSCRPVKQTDVSVAIMGEKSAASYTTDASGTITIDVHASAKLLPSTGWRVTCRKANPTAPHWFYAGVIIEHGAVDENTCGKAQSEPLRGTLVIFTRKSTFFENMAR